MIQNSSSFLGGGDDDDRPRDLFDDFGIDPNEIEGISRNPQTPQEVVDTILYLCQLMADRGAEHLSDDDTNSAAAIYSRMKQGLIIAFDICKARPESIRKGTAVRVKTLCELVGHAAGLSKLLQDLEGG